MFRICVHVTERVNNESGDGSAGCILSETPKLGMHMTTYWTLIVVYGSPLMRNNRRDQGIRRNTDLKVVQSAKKIIKHP